MVFTVQIGLVLRRLYHRNQYGFYVVLMDRSEDEPWWCLKLPVVFWLFRVPIPCFATPPPPPRLGIQQQLYRTLLRGRVFIRRSINSKMTQLRITIRGREYLCLNLLRYLKPAYFQIIFKDIC